MLAAKSLFGRKEAETEGLFNRPNSRDPPSVGKNELPVKDMNVSDLLEYRNYVDDENRYECIMLEDDHYSKRRIPITSVVKRMCDLWCCNACTPTAAKWVFLLLLMLYLCHLTMIPVYTASLLLRV